MKLLKVNDKRKDVYKAPPFLSVALILGDLVSMQAFFTNGLIKTHKHGR